MALIRRVPVAWLMLVHQRKRLLVSLAAVGFAVLVMFMELGFFNGLNDSQAMLPAKLDADLVMMHHKRVHLNKWNAMDLNRLYQARAVQGVRECIPLYQGHLEMRHTEDGLLKTVMCLAFPTGSHPFTKPDVANWDDDLKVLDTVLFDRLSRDIYGPVEPGMTIELRDAPFKVAGLVKFGPNFSYDGMVMMSDATWIKHIRNPYAVHLALIRAAPGTDVPTLRARLLAELPDDVILMTPDEVRRREIEYTVRAVPIGAIFGIGLIIGFIIGIIICYQILFNEITDHMAQYATLKAMGFGRGYLMKIVLLEALFLSVLGFLPGVGASLGLYKILERATNVTMIVTPWRLGIVFVLTVLMCIAAGFIAVRKVLKADPAGLF